MRVPALFRNLFHRSRVERDLDDELRAYLSQLVDEKRRTGLNETEARRAALTELGGLEQVKEEVRQIRSGQMLTEFLQDLRYAVRTLRKNPAFTLAAVLVLALGIGATAAMFSVLYGLLLRPLPYAGADRVAVVFMRYYPRDFQFGTMCVRDFLEWKTSNRAFEDPSLFSGLRMDIGGSEGVPEQVQGASVTAGFFSALGASPVIGRTFVSGEDQPGTRALAVLSESIWRRRFAADSRVLGETILVNGAPSTVIGVMPGAIRFPGYATEVWTNLRLDPPSRYGPWFYRGVARLKPGITLQQAQAETNNIGLRMMQQNPYYKRLTLPVLSLRDALLGTTVKPAILLLAGAVGLVLMIAVVNVANLTLARGIVRRREMALRLSLGAGRGRLVRQLLTESVLLAMSGGVTGLALAWGAIELIRAWNPGDLPLIDSVRLDGCVFGFVGLISFVTSIPFGLAPALDAMRADLNSTIGEGGRGGTASRSHARARTALVVAEVAISLILLVGAGLLLRSFANLQGVTGGFSTPPKRILTMLISPGSAKYRDASAGLPFYDEVLRHARNVPGVEMAAVTDSLPPDRQGDADTFEIEGRPLAAGELNPVVSSVTAGPDYFKALGIPLVKGRYFTEQDRSGSRAVAIVSENFARRFFPNEEAIGRRIKQSGPGAGGPWMEIVGVTGNVKYLGLATDTDPAYYMPFAQNYGSRMFLVVRSSCDASGVAERLREDVQSIDRGVTLAQVGTMEQALRHSVAQPRFDAMLMTLFAGIAVVLAAAGVYGVIAYSVAQRTQEIGVRMALGAAQGDVVRMVVRQGVPLAGLGITIGLGGALALSRFLRTMLFNTGVTDGFTFAAASAALMMVVLLATLIPAVRASRVSPMEALRYE